MSERVKVPEFEIYSSPAISINDIKSRRYNLFDRIEPTINFIIEEIKHYQDNNTRDYIVSYIYKYKKYENLKAALKQVHPEHETTLDKLLALK